MEDNHDTDEYNLVNNSDDMSSLLKFFKVKVPFIDDMIEN